MFRMTFLMVFAVQISILFLAGVLVYSLVFNPEAIGATFAKIIIGFQQAFGDAV